MTPDQIAQYRRLCSHAASNDLAAVAIRTALRETLDALETAEREAERLRAAMWRIHSMATDPQFSAEQMDAIAHEAADAAKEKP